MLIIELLLFGCIIFLGVRASISDCRNSIIPNRLLLGTAPVILALDLVYYGFFARPYLSYALINLLFIAIFCFFLYSFNLWAAGDSKLLFLLTLAIPARYYTYWVLGPFPGFILLVIIFSTAFLYVIGDSVKQGIKQGDLFDLSSVRFNVKALLWSYFFMVGTLTACNFVLIPIIGSIFTNGGLLLTAIDFMIIFALRQFREKINDRNQKIAAIILWAVLISLQVFNIIPRMRYGIDLKSWCVVLVVMLLRFIAEKYNYQEIKVNELKPRMIPSAYTVLKFRTSRVKDLPTGVTEDLRSRLSDIEIEAIKRWKNTKQGSDTIIIVRKIPFAIFIFIGTVLFLILEVILIWRT